MKNDLYKAFAGSFYMLDKNGNSTDYYKDYSLFKNTFGIAFFIQASTKDRCWAIYFARDYSEWNFRTVFPVGKIIETDDEISIKTRYNYFVWRNSKEITEERIESLFQWIKENGDTYIPGLKKHPGVINVLQCDSWKEYGHNEAGS